MSALTRVFSIFCLSVFCSFVCFFLNLANSINKIQFIPIYNHTITFIKGILKKKKKMCKKIGNFQVDSRVGWM